MDHTAATGRWHRTIEGTKGKTGPTGRFAHRLAVRVDVSARAVLTRFRSVDRGHLRWAGGVHRDHWTERVSAGQGVGRVSQRPEQPELGPVVVGRAGVVV